MIPARFIQVESIPLTANGKVDKKALDSHTTQLQTGVEYAAPENEDEKKVAGIWAEVLKLEKVGIHDNFFELGGNSLKLIQVNTRLIEIFAKDIPIINMFRYPTIRTLTGYLNREADMQSLPDSDRKEELKKGKDKMKALKKKMRQR
jgi:acyl carrier protein